VSSRGGNRRRKGHFNDHENCTISNQFLFVSSKLCEYLLEYKLESMIVGHRKGANKQAILSWRIPVAMCSQKKKKITTTRRPQRSPKVVQKSSPVKQASTPTAKPTNRISPPEEIKQKVKKRPFPKMILRADDAYCTSTSTSSKAPVSSAERSVASV